ncbi:hypothetical protein BV20DRAFT_968785 [Pilatotrama ljubarskyi]|nr:hypothetical protein BV20DRAFT_968785 [Pilatotrama ljubarskyi]
MPPTPASTALCLACSASLPPRKAEARVYYTPCCSRPICPLCVTTNPRLTRYNPCLRCLAGVNAVNSRPSVSWKGQFAGGAATVNIDGSVRDEDIFVVEDEDDSDGDSCLGRDGAAPPDNMEGPAADLDGRTSTPRGDPSAAVAIHGPSSRLLDKPPDIQAEQTVVCTSTPPKYFIRPDDTLLGISLKLGIDARILCRLNNLPLSALRTTPHLLHTRTSLALPRSAAPPPPLSPAEQALDEERKARIARERAETLFQTMTKETDRGVAMAYVALAGLPDGGESDFKEYEKEKGLRRRRARAGQADEDQALEGRAMDHYFDDEEWEARERAEGRKAALPSFPYVPVARSSQSDAQASSGREKSSSRWKWKS